MSNLQKLPRNGVHRRKTVCHRLRWCVGGLTARLQALKVFWYSQFAKLIEDIKHFSSVFSTLQLQYRFRSREAPNATNAVHSAHVGFWIARTVAGCAKSSVFWPDLPTIYQEWNCSIGEGGVNCAPAPMQSAPLMEARAAPLLLQKSNSSLYCDI